jgi:hypothetical protein
MKFFIASHEVAQQSISKTSLLHYIRNVVSHNVTVKDDRFSIHQNPFLHTVIYRAVD